MKKLSLVCAGLALAVGAPAMASAQAITPFALEVRGGAGVPTGDFADFAKAGWSVGANVSYMVSPILGVYAGYNYGRFPLKDGMIAEEFPGAPSDVVIDATDSGFSVGALARIPAVPLGPWVRGGLVYHQFGMKVSGDGVSGSFNSDHGLGFEVGGGLSFPVAPKISLTPGASFRSFKPKVGSETGEPVTDFTVDLGLRITL